MQAVWTCAFSYMYCWLSAPAANMQQLACVLFVHSGRNTTHNALSAARRAMNTRKRLAILLLGPQRFCLFSSSPHISGLFVYVCVLCAPRWRVGCVWSRDEGADVTAFLTQHTLLLLCRPNERRIIFFAFICGLVAHSTIFLCFRQFVGRVWARRRAWVNCVSAKWWVRLNYLLAEWIIRSIQSRTTILTK